MKNFQTILILFLNLFMLVSCTQPNTSSYESDDISKEKIILALGDSLTAGYGVESQDNYPSKLEAKLQENNYNYTVINAGISGDTSAEVLARAESYLSKNPDILILVVGGNDGLKGLPVADMKENILAIIDMYQTQGTQIVLGGMDIFPTLGLGYRSNFKKVYKQVVKERDNIEFYTFFLSGVATKNELNIRDKVHPNSAGYDIIVEKLYEFMKKKKIL